MACHHSIGKAHSCIVHVENPEEYYTFMSLKKKEEIHFFVMESQHEKGCSVWSSHVVVISGFLLLYHIS